ncbi:MAG: hypothetical protein ACRCZ0_08085 [Cetobacterium sp.]
MFIITSDINTENFKIDIDNAIKNLNISANMYYNKWTVDVSNYINYSNPPKGRNPAPEANLNYSGYLFQRRRSKLLNNFKYIFFKFVNGDLQQNENFLTHDEMSFLLRQPEIKQLFFKYSIIIPHY